MLSQKEIINYWLSIQYLLEVYKFYEGRISCHLQKAKCVILPFVVYLNYLLMNR